MIQTISVVIPICNEEETLPILYSRLIESLQNDFSSMRYQVIFVDDGSTDRSQKILRNYASSNASVQVLCLSRNFGHMAAISAGLDYAIGDYVVMMDGDLQDSPEDIKALYDKLQEGYDVVYSQRLNKQFSWWRRWTSFLFLKILKLLLNEPVEMSTTVFRMMRKKVVQEVIKLRERQRYIIGLIGWVGFRHTSIPIAHSARIYGTTKYGLLKLINHAIDTICSFSTYPLKMITRLGFIFMIVSFLLSLIIILQHITYGSGVIGWSSIVLSVLFMGGLQLFSLGVFGEYMGRSYIELKRRPLYIINEIINCSISDSNDLKINIKNGYQKRDGI